MGGALGQIVTLVVANLGALYILAVLLRFLLQAARADFYNPLTQAIVRITAGPLAPFRRVIPGYRGFDFASLVLALALNSLFTATMILAAGFSLPSIGIIISWAFVGLLSFVFNIYYFGLIIQVIASFIAPFSGNPILLMIYQILDPINSRVRRVIPPMGGLDLSPLFIFLGIKVLQIIILTPLVQQLRLDPRFVIGI